MVILYFFFFQAEDGIRDYKVTGVQTCALPISVRGAFSLVRIAASEWPRKNALRDFTPSFLKNCHEYHRSEEHTSELQSPCISYAVFCLKKKKTNTVCSRVYHPLLPLY